MKIDDKTMQALASSLNFRQMRNDLISSNIANAETPGYKAKAIDFEEALSRALDIDGNLSMNTADNKHYDVGSGGFNNLQPEIYEETEGVTSIDGNTVDRDKEMALMAENQLLYNATVQLLNKKLGMLKYISTSEKQ